MKKFLLLSVFFIFTLSLFAQTSTIDEFIKAAGAGDNTKVRKCVEEDHIDVDAKNADGITALMAASDNNRKMGTMRLLVKELGANINAKDNTGRTAQMRSARRGYIWVVLELAELGADRTAKDDNGMTAIENTKDCGNMELAVELEYFYINLDYTESKQKLEAYVGNKLPNDAYLVYAVLEKLIKDIEQNNYDIPPRALAVIARKENWDFMEKTSALFPEFYEPIKFLADGFFKVSIADSKNPYTKTNLIKICDKFRKTGKALELGRR